MAQMPLQRWPLVKVTMVIVQGCHLPELQLLATLTTPTCHRHPTRLSRSWVPAPDGQHRRSVLRHWADMIKQVHTFIESLKEKKNLHSDYLGLLTLGSVKGVPSQCPLSISNQSQ